jgi:hypothetical protein
MALKKIMLLRVCFWIVASYIDAAAAIAVARMPMQMTI